MSSAGPAEAFTSREQAYLSSLPAVEHVTSGRIYYTEAFKKECVRRYHDGESASRIFEEAGMPSGLIGYKRIERSIARWSKSLPSTSGIEADALSAIGVPHTDSVSLHEVTACIRRIEQRLACIESRLGMQAGECSENDDTPIDGDYPGARLAPVDR